MTDSDGYTVVDPESLPATPDYPCDRRSIDETAGLNLLAVADYEIAPGEQLPRTYHYHEQREEVFFVRSGTLAVETPGREYEVSAGQWFAVQPGNPHRPYNPASADEAVCVLGIGAPASDMARPYADD